MKTLSYDQLMTFLADHRPAEIKMLATDQTQLTEALLDYRERNYGNLAPDSWEALNAADSDAELYERAEKTLSSMLAEGTEVFATLIAAVRQIDPDGDLAGQLELYDHWRGLLTDRH